MQNKNNEFIIKILSEFYTGFLKKQNVAFEKNPKNINKYVNSVEDWVINNVVPFCDENTKTVIDIGCGIGLGSYFLYRHLKDINIELETVYLLDCKTPSAKGRRGQKSAYHTKAKSYGVRTNVKTATCGFMKKVEKAKMIELPFKYIDADEDKELYTSLNYDIAMSRRSWGFHYPIKEYSHLKFTKGIIDVRPNQKEELRNILHQIKGQKNIYTVVFNQPSLH